MTDFRALCEELLEAANTLLGQGESPAKPGERLILTVHLENLEDCANRARAALAEQPVAPTPIPVAERLPGPEDCDAGGQCWWWDTAAESWILSLYASWTDYTHWLPANALPVPSND